jgi:hypothetical protein
MVPKNFNPKINQDRVVNNFFDLKNNAHEDRIKFESFKAFFESRRTKSPKFSPKLGPKS